MHWKQNSLNHEKAAVLLIMAVTFYLWAVAAFMLFVFGFEYPIASNLQYVIPVCCLIIARTINYFSFKDKSYYRKTLKRYKADPTYIAYIINTLAIVFVFASFGICLFAVTYVLGLWA